jgi:hypothetical protein
MMKTKFDWEHGMSGLPDMSQEALKNYFLYALEPGGFLTSLLCDRPWTEVIGRADHWNKPLLPKYLLWLYENAPAGSWGSEQEVTSWLNKGPAYEQFQKSMVWDILNTDHTEVGGYDF